MAFGQCILLPTHRQKSKIKNQLGGRAAVGYFDSENK
jgi:hypothetical protein